MGALKKIFLPCRLDCFYFVIATIFSMSVLTAFLANIDFDPGVNFGIVVFFLSLLGSAFVAIGAMVGLERASWRRAKFLYLFGAACFVATFIGYLYIAASPEIKDLLFSYALMAGMNPLESRLERLFYIGAIVLLLPIVSWIVFATFKRGPSRLKEYVGGRLNFSRQKILIGITGLLLLGAVVNNILSVSLPNYQRTLGNVSMFLVGILIYFFAFVFLFYLPTKFLTGRSSWWLKIVSVLVAIATLVVAGYFFVTEVLATTSMGMAEMVAFASALAAVLFYWIALLGLAANRNPGSADSSAGADKDEANHHSQTKAKSRVLPSLWGVLACLGILAVIVIPVVIDPTTVIAGGGIENGIIASKVRWNSKGQIQLVSMRGWSVLYCAFDKTTEPDVFKNLSTEVTGLDLSTAANIQFPTMAPQVDFSGFECESSFASFGSGQVTRKQLGDFFKNAINRVSFSDCEILLDGPKFTPKYIQSIYFYPSYVYDAANDSRGIAEQATDLTDLLNSFETFETVGEIGIQREFSPEHWDAIVRASKTTTVNLFRSDLKGLSDEALSKAGPNIHWRYLAYSYDESAAEEILRLLFKSKSTLPLHWSTGVESVQDTGDDPRPVELPSTSDLVYAFPERFDLGYDPTDITGYYDVKGPPTTNHAIFDLDENGVPRGLCLPFSEKNTEIEELAELKTLIFDENYLQSSLVYGTPRDLVVDPSALPKLEHLAFSAGTEVGRMGFLSRLKSLRYLQIPMVDRQSQGGAGFDACPSLEAITMLGAPDSISVTEFQRLPNLKRLTVVDVFEEFSNFETTNQLQNAGVGPTFEEKTAELTKALPGVEVLVVSLKDFAPVVPEELKKHLESKSKTLQEKFRKELEEKTIDDKADDQ